MHHQAALKQSLLRGHSSFSTIAKHELGPRIFVDQYALREEPIDLFGAVIAARFDMAETRIDNLW